MKVDEENHILQMLGHNGTFVVVANFSHSTEQFRFGFGNGNFMRVLDSADASWGGVGPVSPQILHNKEKGTLQPMNVVLYVAEGLVKQLD